MLSLGPPPVPLPARWWLGLTRSQVHRTIHVEMSGPRVQPARHDKGYVLLYVGRGHPYAGRGGTVALHRWLVARALGRRLEPHEHVHHRGVDKTTLDITQLALVEAVEHGQFHYGRNFYRVEGKMTWIWCGEEHTAAEMNEDVEEDL